MPMDCYNCKNESGGPKEIEFFHRMFRFSVFKAGTICTDCKAEEYKKLCDELMDDGFVTGMPDNVEINWDEFCSRRSHEKNRMVDLLLALGILSPKAEGNWCIVSDGEIGLNPCMLFTRVFFTRVKDAVDYARMGYAGTLYGWEIRHISEVLSKNVALDKAL